MNPVVPESQGTDNAGQQLKAVLQALMAPRVQQPVPPRRSNVRLPVRSLDGSFSHSMYDLPRPPAKVKVMTPTSVTGSPADLIKAAFSRAIVRAAGQTKTAGAWDLAARAGNYAKSFLPGAAKAVGQAAPVAETAAANAGRAQRAWQAIKPLGGAAARVVPGALGGAAEGYQLGEQTGVGGLTGATIGAGLGGLAFGPSLKWRNQSGLRPFLQPLRSSLVGSGAGAALDTAANFAGYDTNGAFTHAGFGIGGGLGALGSIGRSGLMAGPAAQTARNWAASGARTMKDFEGGVGSGYAAPFKAIGNAWQRARGIPAAAAATAAAPLSHASVAGKLVGLGTVGTLGLGLGAKMIGNRVGQAVDDKAIELARAAGEVTPHLGQQLGANAGQSAVEQASAAAPRALAQAPGNLLNYLLGRGMPGQAVGPVPVGTGATMAGPDLTALNALGQRLSAGPTAFQPRNEMDYAQQFAGS